MPQSEIDVHERQTSDARFGDVFKMQRFLIEQRFVFFALFGLRRIRAWRTLRAEQQFVRRERKQLAQLHDFIRFGISRVRFPFAHRLPRYAKPVGKLFLRHARLFARLVYSLSCRHEFLLLQNSASIIAQRCVSCKHLPLRFVNFGLHSPFRGCKTAFFMI